jgi:hypothetical protein
MREDRGHTGANVIAAYNCVVAYQDTIDVRDRVERSRLKDADDDTGFARPRALWLLAFRQVGLKERDKEQSADEGE